MEFPIFKTKIKEVNKKFNLTDPKEREEYFKLKAGPEIEKLREYLKENTFVAYLLGKKNSGKGTYSKMFAEITLPERVDHLSIGDMVRAIDVELAVPEKKKELIKYLEKNYRGRFPLDKIIRDLENRDTKTLRPTELILALIKRELEKREKKTLFIDGFPRDLDQISYSLFFRDLIGYREDADIFILIDVPESAINERIKWRRVCPRCQTSRNLKLLPTSEIGYDQKNKESYLLCDNPKCLPRSEISLLRGLPRSDAKHLLQGQDQGTRMVSKEGDELGTKPIKERLELDKKLIEQAFSFYGIPKILLRNSLPVKAAQKFVDDYEITPEYSYQWNGKEKGVKIIEKPWVILDDEGVPSYSLLPPPVVVSLIKQMVEVLKL